MLRNAYLLNATATFRVNYQLLLVATQAAGSRLFEIRNAGTDVVLVPTKLEISWIQNAAHTAAILAGLEVYKATGFTAVDSVDTTTVAGQVHRTGEATAPGNALIRGVTASGVAAGMTGGTVTTTGAPLARFRKWMLQTVPTAGDVPTNFWRAIEQSFGDEKPLVLAPDEGIVVTNSVLLGAAAGSLVNVDLTWTEAKIVGTRDASA